MQPASEEVFLTVHGSPRPLGVNDHLRSALRSYSLRARIRTSRYGAHPIRHAFATRLMDQGTPMKEIADLLGHRNIETTFLYPQSRCAATSQACLEWPEVNRKHDWLARWAISSLFPADSSLRNSPKGAGRMLDGEGRSDVNAK
jgi:integrase